jgi:pimeloyl-ACP methyl ester carboxylesterase
MSLRYIETAMVRQYIGHDAIAHPAPAVHLDLEREVDSDLLQGKQILHMSVADQLDPEALVIVPVSWSSYGKRPFQAARMGSMATFSNSRVVTLDFPGMGDAEHGRGAELTEKQREELHRGRLIDLVKGYWQVLVRHQLDKRSDGSPLPVALWGNSLGTLTATEMAVSAPESIKLQDVLLSEPMALHKMNEGTLAAQFLLYGSRHIGDYYPLNKGFPVDHTSLGSLFTQLHRQPGVHLGVVTALARGQQWPIFEAACKSGRIDSDPEHGTRFHIVSAGQGLTKREENDALAFNLRYYTAARRLIRRQTLVGEGHGYQDALPCVLAQMDYLAVVEDQS